MSPPISASRYEALLPIGTGGVATVSLGRARGSTRLVALKRAHAHVKDDAVLAESLKREARLAAHLRHPNIVGILDVEEIDDELVLVLDYVEGCTLRALTGKLAKLGVERPREVLRVVIDVAHGLHAAHDAGLVHRDVSPSNVLLGIDGLARIADFGIAKAQFDATDRTETGMLKGKSSYMAPEYVLHQRAVPASDLFSLAVLAWESLTGARLFKGANDVETLMAVAEAEFRPVATERPALASLDPVLAQALAREPEARQPTLEHFAAELESVAMAHDLVGTHADVAALVKRLFVTELADRRRELENDIETVDQPMSTERMPIRISSKHVPAAPAHSPSAPVLELLPRPISSSIPPRPAPPPPARKTPWKDILFLVAALVFLAAALLLLAHRIRSAMPTPTSSSAAVPTAPAR